MNEISTLLIQLHPLLDTSTLRQLTLISEALLMMTGRVTQLSISRWAEKGGSYRTIHRFFQKSLPWGELNWQLVKMSLPKKRGVILIAGDATTVTKSGRETHGLGKFFSSIYSRAVSGLGFQCLSLIEVERRIAWPILTAQMSPPPKKEKREHTKEKPVKRKRGRPKGSKNKNRRDVQLNTEMTQVKAMLENLIQQIGAVLKPMYFVYDGAFGNNAAVQMTRQAGLHLISKLRNNSALYFQWEGVYSGIGRRPVYGQRIDYNDLPELHLKSDETKNTVRTRIYQLTAIHKKFSDKLNVVIIHKENTDTGKVARIILFSTHLALEWNKLIDYYRLRFQIEFNFRDAKQHWGLEDFMSVKEQSVLNSANLSLFMVNLSQTILITLNQESILDMKSRYHALRYAREVFKILPENVECINIKQLFEKIPVLGQIHGEKMAA